MSTTVFDASLSTARRRQLALYTWRVNNIVPGSDKYAPEQPGVQSGPRSSVPVDVTQGARLIGQQIGQNHGNCTCGSDVTLAGDVRKAPAGYGTL